MCKLRKGRPSTGIKPITLLSLDKSQYVYMTLERLIVPVEPWRQWIHVSPAENILNQISQSQANMPT